ncbi:MAG: regulatory protein RecX [Candidatus Zixiibacteriota bacterium]
MPRITKLEPQRKHPSRWSIFIDERFFAGCSEEMMASLNLHVGDDLAAQRLDEIRDLLGLTKVRDSALRYLARRSRSESEMRKYLERKGYDGSQIDSTIAWLMDKKYLNDEEFAAAWVRNRQQLAPRGKRRLMVELYQKGIDRDTATQAVQHNISAEDEAEAAYQAVLSRKNRYRGMETLEIKQKIYNFLSYRGFSPDAVASAFERFIKDSNP